MDVIQYGGPTGGVTSAWANTIPNHNLQLPLIQILTQPLLYETVEQNPRGRGGKRIGTLASENGPRGDFQGYSNPLVVKLCQGHNLIVTMVS